MLGKWESTAHLKVNDHTGFAVHSLLFIVVDVTITSPTPTHKTGNYESQLLAAEIKTLPQFLNLNPSPNFHNPFR